jgi:hypothetical protein
MILVAGVADFSRYSDRIEQLSMGVGVNGLLVRFALSK